MGWLRRRKDGVDPSTDEAAVTRVLESAGATPDEAAEITALLGQRLSPPEMMAWLTDTDASHPIRDPDSVEQFGFAMAWTATNAIGAGKTELVLRSAKLFAAGEIDPLEPPPLPDL